MWKIGLRLSGLKFGLWLEENLPTCWCFTVLSEGVRFLEVLSVFQLNFVCDILPRLILSAATPLTLQVGGCLGLWGRPPRCPLWQRGRPRPPSWTAGRLSGNQSRWRGGWRSRHWRGRGRRRGEAPEVKSGLIRPPSSSPQSREGAVRCFGLSCSRAAVKRWSLCSPLTSAIIWKEFKITFNQCRLKNKHFAPVQSLNVSRLTSTG